MLRFEYNDSEDLKNKTIIQDSVEGDIHEVMEVFVRFLKGISYTNGVIILGMKQVIEDIEDIIKEEYIWHNDDIEEKSDIMDDLKEFQKHCSQLNIDGTCKNKINKLWSCKSNPTICCKLCSDCEDIEKCDADNADNFCSYLFY